MLGVWLWRHGGTCQHVALRILALSHRLGFVLPAQRHFPVGRAASLLVDGPGVGHPLWPKFQRIPNITDIDLTRQVMLETSKDEDMRETYKRVLCIRMVALNSHRLTYDKDIRGARSYTSILTQLGPLQPWSEHYQDSP